MPASINQSQRGNESSSYLADKSLARPGRKQAIVSVRMAWISFGALPCRKKKKKNLMTACVLMLLKSRASLTCFWACFLPGRAKDLSAPWYKWNLDMLNILHFPCIMLFIKIQQNTLPSFYRSYYLQWHVLNINHHFGDVYKAMHITYESSTYVSLRNWDNVAVNVTFVILYFYWLLFTVHMDVILMTEIEHWNM